MQKNRPSALRLTGALFITVILSRAAIVFAAVAPQGDPVANRAMGHPDLFVASVHLPLAELPQGLAAGLRLSLSGLSINPDLAAFDVRAGRFGSLVAKTPLVPGPGIGNTLTWAALGRLAPSTDAAYRDAVWQAFRAWLQANQAVLGVAAVELASPSVSSFESNRLVHVYAGRVYGGVPVRDSFVTPPPDTTWPLSFAIDGDFPSIRFVKMAFSTQTCPPANTSNPTGGAGAPCFAYGNGSDPSGAGIPADPSSSFDADGTIRIVVPASALGNPQPGRQFKAFLTRIRIELPGAGALTPDNMPNNTLAPAGSYTSTSCGETDAGAGP
jgi:hypothetical protein